MANRYWVYNGGNINDTTHWSATSGGAGGASKPTLSDNVIFDANSFTLNAQVVTLNESFNCLSMDWTGITKTVTFSSSVYSLNIYGNLTLATNLTWLFTGTAYLNHKATGTVTTNGITLNANRVYFDAAGITVMNGDAANYGVTSFYLTNGTWNTNGKTITSTGSFNTVAGTKTLTLGTSVFNIGTWTNAVPTGFTFNYNTSTVVITTASILTGITSFYNLTCSGVASLTLANNITVTNALTLAGSSVSNRLKILSSVAGTQRTVTVPAVGVIPSNLDVQDIAFPNAVNMSAIAGYSQDFGNNTGITFTASANLYFKHTSGAANWGDITKWFLADRVTQGRIPLIQDDVNFDNLSFTGTSTLNLNVAATCRNMDWTGLIQAVTLSSAVNSLSVYGHTTLAAGLVWTFTGTAYTYMGGIGSWNITTNGVIVSNRLYFDRVGGTWTNQDDFVSPYCACWLANGTWNTNSKQVTIATIFVNPGIKTLTLGSSILTLSTQFDLYQNNINLTFNSDTSLVVLTNTTLSFPFWSKNSNILFNDLSIIGKGVVAMVEGFKCKGVVTLKGNSVTERLVLKPQYNASNPLTASSVIVEYVDFHSCQGLGTANWNLSSALGGSGDICGNTNITFTPALSLYWYKNTGNYNDLSKWFLSTGGTGGTGRIPLPQDCAVFDENSFDSPNSTITTDGLIAYKSGFDFSRITSNQNVAFGTVATCGSLILNPLLTLIGYCGINFTASLRSLSYIKTFGKILSSIWIGGIVGYLPNAAVTLLDDLNCITLYSYTGGLIFNGFSVTAVTFRTSNQTYLDFGGGTFTITGNDFNISSVISYVNSLCHINIQPTSNLVDITVAFRPSSIYAKVTIGGANSGLVLLSGNCTINEITINPGRKVNFTAGTTTTIGKLTAIGTPSQPITIGSITAATHNLVKIGADMVEVEYCNIRNSNATPTDKWAGGDTSFDGGGNSGWTFKYIPIIMWFFGIFSKK